MFECQAIPSNSDECPLGHDEHLCRRDENHKGDHRCECGFTWTQTAFGLLTPNERTA